MLHTLTRSARAVTVFTAAWVCLAFFSVNMAHAAKIYRWVDENGVVTYGDSSHRPETTPSETLKIEAPTPASITGKKAEADAKTGAAEKSAAPPKPPEEPKMSAAEKRKLCTRARNDLTVIQSRGQLREVDAKGNVTALTDEQKQSRIKATRKDIKAYCR